MAKRRSQQERDEADAREQSEARREALIAELRARQAAARPPAPAASAAEPPAAAPDAAPEVPSEDGASEPG